MIQILYDKIVADQPICNFIPKEITDHLFEVDDLEHHHKSIFHKVLQSFKIQYKIVTFTDNTQLGKKVYPIEPHWLKIVGSSYWLDKSATVEKNIVNKQTNLINTDTIIFFWFVKEPFFTDKTAIVLAMQRFFPKNRIILVNCNLKLEFTVDKIKNVSIVGFDYWWLYISKKKLPDLNYHKTEVYAFTFFNRKLCLSRSVIYYHLLKNNLLNEAKHTYHAFIDNLKYYSKEEVETFVKGQIAKENFSIVKNIDSLQGIISNTEWYNWIYEQYANNQANFFPCTDQYISDFSLHNDSYLDIITETYDWIVNSSVHCVSEKTYRSIANGCIFLIIGSPGTLAHLKKHGIETFDDIFDESYDELEHWFDRFKIIEKNLQKWIMLGANGRKKYYQKSFPKLVQNQKILNTRNLKLEFEKILNL